MFAPKGLIGRENKTFGTYVGECGQAHALAHSHPPTSTCNHASEQVQAVDSKQGQIRTQGHQTCLERSEEK